MASVACVAICSQTNAPLFFQCYGTVDTLLMHHLIYSALDICLENLAKQDVPFLGRGIFAYVTPTRNKILVMLGKGEVDHVSIEGV
ncbi:MAG: hypothetical protein EZS28_015794 [Streblomastix strix]|uniref:Uncharacterized protein n=1 Tax=Streblomastix strix TaxID=222440 RepID=A0A5J4W1C5_9EUKA|nr:MAG: hypothetical protein EZS28_015794 [Streblomastix strix]